jgi:hypothetical protein
MMIFRQDDILKYRLNTAMRQVLKSDENERKRESDEGTLYIVEIKKMSPKFIS